MLFSRRQSANRIEKIPASKAHRFTNGLSFKQLGDNRTTNNRRRAAVRQKTCGLNSTITHAQRQPQAITADGIGFFSDGVCVRELARVAGMGEMVFEDFGV